MVNQQRIYCFLSDDSKMFYRASQTASGDYTITKNARPYPIRYNPSNLLNTSIEFATNNAYFSMVRSINYPLDFIKDGAAILRSFYFLGKNVMQKCYLTIIQWNGTTNVYELAYYGRIDFGQKKEDPKSGTFTVPCIDDSTWGILSQHDDVEYAIDCNATNTKAIKVLIDSINLINRYTFQTVQAPITDSRVEDQFQTMPFVLINQDGDSAGLVVTSQTLAPLTFSNIPVGTWQLADPLSPGYFLLTQYATTIHISGTIKFEWSALHGGTGGLGLFIVSNKRSYPATGNFAFGNVITYQNNLIAGKIYEFNYDFTLDLDADERLFLVVSMEAVVLDEFTITPLINNSTLTTTTKAQPVIVYGLRPLDYLQQLVAKATNNRFTINSQWFTTNNKDIITCGDAIRQVPDAKIYGSFKDFFQTFNAIYFLALRVANGDLFIEKATEVYKDSGVIVNIGDAIDIQTTPAMEYYGNEIQVGGTNQDYRHPSGRLEFNVPNTFSLPIDLPSGNKKLVYVTKYRTGCYDIMFMILDYQNQSTQDNSGDKNVYLLSITDEQTMAVDNIETFENINVDNAPLEPIIKQPLNNDTITNGKPVIKGIAPPGSNVSIYADTVLDGSTTADGSGNWSYVLVNSLSPYLYPTQTGIHVIQASYTDLSAPNSSITVLITSDVQPCLVIYPQPNDNLYNNIPLIKGVAQFGDTVQVEIDGVIIGTLTADESCKWQLYPGVAIPNGSHVLTVVDGVQTVVVNFIVDSNVDYPLITYIASELDGFLVITGLPLIKGVAKPGTDVDLWLNYISYRQLNWDSTLNSRIPIIADVNGNWSFQVIPVNYLDPLTGLPVILAPIINGLNIIATSLINHVVGISVLGYKLNRPAYNSITGVPDNTVFNTLYSPKRMLANQYPMLSAILKPQPLESIIYQTSPKNGTLKTVLGTEVIQENANIPVSSLGNPLVLLEKAIVKTKTNKTFAQTLYDFTNGGLIKTNFRGTDLYFVPIGSMKISNISSDVQEWTILMSPNNSYLDLLNLYKNGLLITLNKNTMYHSDRNSLHLVTYGFTPAPQYNFIEIYDDWFSRRNSAWVLNPDYIQKFQTSEIIKDQIIVNGASGLTLQIFRCKDASLVDTINYVAVTPAPINPPNIVLEAEINWGSYAPDQYFTILFSGTTPIAIGERIQTKTKWLGTILIESNDDENDVGFFYSTGIKTILRTEGLVKKLQPSLNTIIAQEESGDTEILYAQNSKKRVIRFGTAYGLPDYLYLKIADALTNSNCFIENVAYTLDKDEKINPSDDVDGHPLYYYNVNMTLRDNDKGKTFTVPGDNSNVVLVVQGQAIGLPPDSLLNITLDSE